MRQILYVLDLKDKPTIREVVIEGAITIHDRTYCLIEASQLVPHSEVVSEASAHQASARPQPFAVRPEIPGDYEGRLRAQIIRRFESGARSATQIAKEVQASNATVRNILRSAGLKTPADEVSRRIIETLEQAGSEGVPIGTLKGIVDEAGTRLAPYIGHLFKSKRIRRLANGNYMLFSKP